MSANKKVAALVAVLTMLLATANLAWATRPKGALERFDRKSLVIVYISESRQDGSRFAFIQDPDFYSHRVEAGDYLGKDAGKIVKIGPREIVVVEIVKVGTGYQERSVTITCTSGCAAK